MIKNEFPNVIVIKNEKNFGVAPARNQGMKIAKGKYNLILDADVELIENSILKLYKFMEENPETGMLGAKLIDNIGNLQFSCKRYPSILALIFRRLENFKAIKNSSILNYHIMKDWNHQSIKDVDYLIGACQFIRKKTIDEIGLYDDKIFYGPEDIDYCIRIWRANFKVKYYPLTKIIHHEQRITQKKIFSAISIAHLKGIIYIFIKYKGKLSP